MLKRSVILVRCTEEPCGTTKIFKNEGDIISAIRDWRLWHSKQTAHVGVEIHTR